MSMIEVAKYRLEQYIELHQHTFNVIIGVKYQPSIDTYFWTTIPHNQLLAESRGDGSGNYKYYICSDKTIQKEKDPSGPRFEDYDFSAD